PTPIPQRTVAEVAPRADEQVRAASASLAGAVERYELGAETPGRGWLDYVQGLTWALRADGALILGFDLRVASSVPIGAGLASSGALEVAVLRALRAAFRLPLDDVELALLGQRAENEFVGARVGVMDQMAASPSACGRRSPRWRWATSSAWAPCWTPPTPRCATTTRSRRPRSISWSRSPARSRRLSAHA